MDQSASGHAIESGPAVRPIYRRILLKLSGEALIGCARHGIIDPLVLDRMAREIGEIMRLSVQVGVVIGGGNLFRGSALSALGIKRITGDHMGMLATIMNALAFRDAFERASTPCRIMSAIPMSGVVDHYDRRKAIHHLESGRVVLFAAGTGNPLVTTDSAASLRSIEIEADALFKATKVDGVYSADPAQDPDAVRYRHLTFGQVLEKELGVMDLAAFCQCRDQKMPLRIFDMNKPGALLRVVMGEEEGTCVSVEKES